MKIYSWNVNGIRSVLKKGFEDWFTATDPVFLEPERFFRVNGKIRAVPCDPWREGEAR